MKKVILTKPHRGKAIGTVIECNDRDAKVLIAIRAGKYHTAQMPVAEQAVLVAENTTLEQTSDENRPDNAQPQPKKRGRKPKEGFKLD
jgi:hypothetical protein